MSCGISSEYAMIVENTYANFVINNKWFVIELYSRK